VDQCPCGGQYQTRAGLGRPLGTGACVARTANGVHSSGDGCGRGRDPSTVTALILGSNLSAVRKGGITARVSPQRSACRQPRVSE